MAARRGLPAFIDHKHLAWLTRVMVPLITLRYKCVWLTVSGEMMNKPPSKKESTMTKNPFDFNDVSDLPENLAKSLTVGSDRSTAAREWADVVVAGKEAGYAELNINQIMAAATRMGLTVPGTQTVRGYLTRAVELGYLHKPSQRSYAVAKRGTKAEDAGLSEHAEVITGEVMSDVAEVPVAVDPLAGL